jgi:Putative transposase/Transposase zinc-binding domain
MASLADIVRGEGARYLQTHFTTPEQRKALRDIAGCRTEAMGSVTVTCNDCRIDYSMFRSCRNRSCPQCGGEARMSWLEARKAEILTVPYSHVVFTPPAEFNELALHCPREFYDCLMRAAGQAAIEVGWSELHLQLGCEAHLHTWGQDMPLHPHVHCVVPCGGFTEDGRWVSFKPDELPAEALASRFRALLCKAIRAGARKRQFERVPQVVETIVETAGEREWRVYAKPPFGGPEQLLSYLAKYMYRVAITNDRIESYSHHQVTFLRREPEPPCTLDAQEFLRRFLLHVLPTGFVRVRSYGFMANRNRRRNNERARERIDNPETARQQEPFRPLRLCPACYEARRNGRTPDPLPRPYVTPQLVLTLRPPPIQPVAA